MTIAEISKNGNIVFEKKITCMISSIKNEFYFELGEKPDALRKHKDTLFMCISGPMFNSVSQRN